MNPRARRLRRQRRKDRTRWSPEDVALLVAILDDMSVALDDFHDTMRFVEGERARAEAIRRYDDRRRA